MGKKGALGEGKRGGGNAKEQGGGPKDTKSLAKAIDSLQRNASDQTASAILPKIHKIIQRSNKKRLIDYQKIKEKLRICKVCDKWNHISSILQCSICEDNYHKSCLNASISSPFVCSDCQLVSKAHSLCAQCKQ